MARRANGEGSVRKRADGKGWEARLGYIDPETGTNKRISLYGKTAKEVRAKLKEARDRLYAGAPVRDANKGLSAWLTTWRVTTLAVSDRKESTKSLYGSLSAKHLEPAPFGSITLAKLKPSDIEGLVLSMRGKLKEDGTRALSDSTIRTTYTVLRAALDGAVRDGLLARNPAVAVKRPGIERTEAKHVEATDVTALLTVARQSKTRYYVPIALIAATGLRKGEALALRWVDIDLDKGTLNVRGTLSRVGGRLTVTEPKTQRSRRTVPLSPGVIALLGEHRVAQDAERENAANLWTESGLVFTTEFGTAVDPRNMLRATEVAAKRAGLTQVGVHTLRHSAAVAWLESGVHIKAISDLLGHSSIAITGDVYGHTSDETARSAVDGLTNSLGL
ncbi:MAG: site-specific integrase [Rhodococcus sp. (in: high G+C Gram-positive bacteria)]|uniref:tyrosine-type recombinase/integrase n=1 Tax=Rhodococcus sp. TaxID=1831 RepID=UPI002AD5E8B9|nr:site-specific integrase [Rhodococcus sp. (in: high G+C Gram-positive bacteria)]